MPRGRRVNSGGYCYHVLNRTNGRLRLSPSPEGYSHYYTYDGLHRLDKFGRGTLNSTGDDTTGYPTYRERDWSLDVLGNWMDVDDYGESGTPTSDYFQRSHNYANEITSRTVSTAGAPRSIVDEFSDDTRSNYEVLDGAGTDLSIASNALSASSLKSTRDSKDFTIALTPAGADYSRSGCGAVSTEVTLPTGSDKAGIVFGYRAEDDFWLFVADEAADKVQLYHVTSTTYAPTDDERYFVAEANRNVGTSGTTLSFQCRSGRFLSGDGLLDVELSGGVPAGRIGLYTETTSATFDYLHAREAETFTDVLGRWDCAAANVSIVSEQLQMQSSADEPYDCPILRKGLRLEEHQAKFYLNTTSTAGAVRYVFYVQDTNNYHFVEIPWNDNTQQTCTLGKVVDGGEAEALATGNITLDDATTYEVRITVEGRDVKVEYSDGSWTTVLDTSGNDYLPSDSGGRLGFAITSGTACLDDVAVMTDPAGGTSFVDSQMPTEDFASGTVSPTYDAAGNLTSDGVRGYVYDAWNRLVKVSDGQTTVAEYRYDGLGRRIRKYVPDGENWTVTEYYYSADWQVLEVRRDGGIARSGSPLSEPTLATTLREQYVWSPRYIDSPILRDRDAAAGGDLGKTGSGLDERLYYLTDAQMNVTALVNTDGDAVERYTYDSYGKVTIYDGTWTNTRSSSSYANEVLYCGYRLDTETGLYQVRNRVYHPLLGRWVQRDPLDYADGMSLYQYVGSRPIRISDPMGLGWFDDAVKWAEKKAAEARAKAEQAYEAKKRGASTEAIWDASPYGDIGKRAFDYGDWWQKDQGGGWGNAARHGYWQAALTLVYDAEQAKAIGDAHEVGATDAVDTAIDLYNNDVARRIGQRIKDQGGTVEDVKNAIDQALKDGSLITNANDPRIPGPGAPGVAPTPTSQPASTQPATQPSRTQPTTKKSKPATQPSTTRPTG